MGRQRFKFPFPSGNVSKYAVVEVCLSFPLSQPLCVACCVCSLGEPPQRRWQLHPPLALARWARAGKGLQNSPTPSPALLLCFSPLSRTLSSAFYHAASVAGCIFSEDV